MVTLWCCKSHPREDDGASTKDEQPRNTSPPTNLSNVSGSASAAEVPQSHRAAAKDPPIPLSTPCRELPELEALVVEDSDGEEAHQPLTRRASAAFGAVRTRLHQHLSSDRLRIPRSHTSIGNSDQEIARRAELRRLRQKRIQDELNGEVCEENRSVKSSKSTRPTPSVTYLSLNRGGPRDTIEFTVLAKGHAATDSHPQIGDMEPQSLENESANPSKRKSEIRYLISGEHHGSSNVVKPEQLDGQLTDHDPEYYTPESTAPTRSAERLSELTAPPSKTATMPLRRVSTGFLASNTEHSSSEDQSALGIWLLAQALPSRESSLACIGEPAQPKRSISDVDEEVSTISAHSGSRRIESSLRQDLHNRSPTRPEGDADANTPDTAVTHPLQHFPSSKTNTTRRMSTSSSQAEGIAENYAIALAFQDPIDTGSSNYTSAQPSFQPSPSRSQVNHDYNAEELQNLQLSPFQWNEHSPVLPEARISEGKSSYVTAEEVKPTTEMGAQYLSRPTPHGSSAELSESASFCRREAELNTIEKRFSDKLSRKQPQRPFTSRFKEEFASPCLCNPGDVSILSRFHSVLSRTRPKNETATDGENMTARQKAIVAVNDDQKKPSNDRSPIRSSREMSKNRVNDDVDTQKEFKRPRRPELEIWSLLTGESQQELSESASRRVKLSTTDHTPGTRSVQQLNDSTSFRKALSSRGVFPSRGGIGSAVWKAPPWRVVMPPESWAKYPSHTRDERNGIAKAADTVRSHDFAVRVLSEEGEILWTTDKSIKANNSEEAHELPRQAKLSQAVKTKVSRMFCRGSFDDEMKRAS